MSVAYDDDETESAKYQMCLGVTQNRITIPTHVAAWTDAAVQSTAAAKGLSEDAVRCMMVLHLMSQLRDDYTSLVAMRYYGAIFPAVREMTAIEVVERPKVLQAATFRS